MMLVSPYPYADIVNDTFAGTFLSNSAVFGLIVRVLGALTIRTCSGSNILV
ncbi:hypothetical protein [Paenibacillus hemerocallicola]|uniref:hypothetical protein n=1 Tax=Paenibacillus hemerocallicola TaxID=1172614 RepID=UPI001FE6DCFB|nr:hypothetical protein [Paenibacillus hemerocallicola]